MKNTRIIALALASMMSLSLLTACAPKEEPTEASKPAVTEPAETETEAETEAPDATDPNVGGLEDPNGGLDGMGGVDDMGVTPDGEIGLSNTDFTFFTVGDTYKILVSNLLEGDTVTFASSDEAVATVAEDGTVTAVANGTANITVTVLVDGVTEVELTAVARCSIKEANTSATLDFDVFYQELAAASDYQAGMMKGEGEMLQGFYPTMGDYDFAQAVVYLPMMSAVASELAFIEVKDAADIDAAKAVLQARIDAQVAGGAWYPETIEKWKTNSRIVSNGNFVMMVVGDNLNDVVSAFNAKF